MFPSMAANRIQPKSAFIVGSAELGILKTQQPLGKIIVTSYINFKTKTM